MPSGNVVLWELNTKMPWNIYENLAEPGAAIIEHDNN